MGGSYGQSVVILFNLCLKQNKVQRFIPARRIKTHMYVLQDQSICTDRQIIHWLFVFCILFHWRKQVPVDLTLIIFRQGKVKAFQFNKMERDLVRKKAEEIDRKTNFLQAGQVCITGPRCIGQAQIFGADHRVQGKIDIKGSIDRKLPAGDPADILPGLAPDPVAVMDQPSPRYKTKHHDCRQQ